MSKNTIQQLIKLCVGFALIATVQDALAQFGTNAPPYNNNCQCEAPWLGYYQTRWHRWPGAPYPDMPKPAANAGTREIPPSQIDLPSPKTELETKPNGTAHPYSSSGETTPQSLPEESPANSMNQKPEKPQPESAPESNPENKPSLELPGTEPPSSDLPSPSSESNSPKSNDAPPATPKPSESKPSELQMPSSETNPFAPSGTDSKSGASSSWPGKRLRRHETVLGNHDVDPAPEWKAVPVVMCANESDAPPTPPLALVSGTSTVEFCKTSGEPELIAPSSNSRPLDPAKTKAQSVHDPMENPLRGGVQPTNWTAPEPKRVEVAPPVSDSFTTAGARANPLR